jgi:hypothetical protein
MCFLLHEIITLHDYPFAGLDRLCEKNTLNRQTSWAVGQDKYVVRMKCNVIRESAVVWKNPDYTSFHPGYSLYLFTLAETLRTQRDFQVFVGAASVANIGNS